MKFYHGRNPVEIDMPEDKQDRPSFLARLLSRIFKYKYIVNCEHSVYLRRWYLFKSKYLTLFLHQFVRSDEDRALHDHPWAFLVVPIWRGYTEHHEKTCPRCHGEGFAILLNDCSLCGGVKTIDGKARVLPIIGTRYRNENYRHRVELLPCANWFCIVRRRIRATAKAKGWPLAASAECPHCRDSGVLPAWSIFFHFRRVKDWGFWIPEGIRKRFVLWNKWWRDNKCE